MPFNPNQAGLFWLFCGRGVESTPPPPPPEISAVDRAITMKIGTYVTCGVIYQTIQKKIKMFIFYFILINNANLCVKSYVLL